MLGHMTAVTERIGLGSALMQIPARTPAATAMTAATLDVLSGGRFRLGLGVSGPQVSEGWHGVPFARPLARTREYVEIVRKALAREGPLEYQGKRVPAAARGQRAGQAAQAARQAGERAHPDLPRRDRAQGDRADGQDRGRLDPVHVQPRPRGGAARAVQGAPTWTSRRPRSSAWTRTATAPATSPAPGSPPISARWARSRRTSTWRPRSASGTGTPPARFRGCSRAGDRAGAAKALTPELIDGSAICCDYGELDERLAAYERAGADTLLALPFGDRPRIIEALGAAVLA